MKIPLPIKIGRMPNFLMVDLQRPPEKPKQADVCLDVGQLSDAEVDEYVKLWANKFRAHANERRRQLTNAPTSKPSERK